jgi:glycosyltransferase involved in cell wall biosynthesis
VISVVINAKNEERWIAQTIASVRDHADEVIVADMASSDATRRIAIQSGARVIDVPDYGYVEPARRAAVDAATGDWVLILDADEVVAPGLFPALRRVAADPEVDGVVIHRQNYFFGGRIHHAGWGLDVDRHMRAFRKDRVSLPDDIHHPIALVPGARLEILPADPDVSVVHFNYVDWSHFVEKMNRYTSIEARTLAASDEPLPTRRMLGEMRRELVTRYVRQRGYRDGVRGLGLSVLMSVYRMLVHLKARQLRDVGDEAAIVQTYQRVAREQRAPRTPG